MKQTEINKITQTIRSLTGVAKDLERFHKNSGETRFFNLSATVWNEIEHLKSLTEDPSNPIKERIEMTPLDYRVATLAFALANSGSSDNKEKFLVAHIFTVLEGLGCKVVDFTECYIIARTFCEQNADWELRGGKVGEPVYIAYIGE